MPTTLPVRSALVQSPSLESDLLRAFPNTGLQMGSTDISGAVSSAIIAAAHPRTFIRGHLAQMLTSPSGTEPERQQYLAFRSSDAYEHVCKPRFFELYRT